MRKLPHAHAAAELLTYGVRALDTYPGLADEWRGECVTCGQEVQARLKSARRFGRAHRRCPGNPKRTRRLPDAVARAVMLAAQLLPLEPYTENKTPWPCRCLVCGAEDITPKYNKVQQEGHGCRHCGIERRRRLRRHDPLMMEAEYRRLGGIPDIAYPGVEQAWPGVCAEAGHPVKRTWKAIKRSGYFCTYCSGARVLPEVAVAAMVAVGCTPLDPWTSSGTRWRSECHRCHRTIWPMYDSITAGQGPCVYCGHNKVDPEEARLAMIDAGAIPRVPFPGADTDWECACGRCAADISPRYNNTVVKGTDPCIFCSRRRISRTEAYALAAEHDLEPLEEFRLATQVWPCRCTRCNGTARTVLSLLKFSGARGCPVCARGGFRLLDPAQVYLLHNAALGVYKVGVTNAYEYRIREHRRHDFIPVQLDGGPAVWPVATGSQALAVESAVLTLWRADLHVPQALTPAQMPQHGATETARLTAADLAATLSTLLMHLPAPPAARSAFAPEPPRSRASTSPRRTA
jgi:hypothetical protein